MVKALKTQSMLALLGGAAVFAAFLAQISSNACAVWAWEQPKMPKSLLKKD